MPQLRRAADRMKDQSYVLAAVEPAALRKARFPLGEYHKSEVRDIARRAKLPIAEKRESQEICFVPSNDYRDLLRSRGVEGTPGAILDGSGREIGRHEGFEGFTIGQRRGIGVASTEALYVTSIDPRTATVSVGTRSALGSTWLESDSATWFQPTRSGARFHVQLRAHHDPIPAIVQHQDSGVLIEFEDGAEAVAPGQLAVLYDSEEFVVGSCWIDRTGKSR
jgi:tRNA-specific 2-thiouridylase